MGPLGDIRFSLRTLLSNPGFAVLAITVLALGIGVNAAVFTVTNAALFRGFRSVNTNDRILYIHSEKNGKYSGVSYPDFQDWQIQAKSFDDIGAVAFLRLTLSNRGGFPESYSATQITANGFKLIGQQPFLGRDFSPSDEMPGASPVAILNYGFWKRRYGGDPAIIGQTLSTQGTPRTTVIGVMPEGFSFPQNQDLWVPLVPSPDLQQRDARDLWFAFGRLADGATRKSARAELNAISGRLARTYPATNQGQVAGIHSFTEFFVGPNATIIYGAMWGAVGFVLLIACANLANMLLARSIVRSREVSLQIALGAGLWRIMRQSLIESLMLSSVGGLLGSALAKWGVRVYEVATNPPAGQWRHNLLDYTMDYRVLAYLMATTIGAGLLFGLAPALRFSRLDLNNIMQDSSRSAIGRERGKRLSGLLVIVQVALAVILVAATGVMIRSFLNMYAADLGFRAKPAKVLVAFLNLPEPKYPNREAQNSLFERLKTHLEAVPGVESVSIGNPPASGIPGGREYEVADGRAPEVATEDSRRIIPSITIGPDYFRTLGVTVLSGREFNNFDRISELPAVIVNQRFAGQHWPQESPLGKHLRLFTGKTPGPWLTVVGMVSNMVHDPLRQKIEPVVYVPYRQTTRSIGGMWVLVRTALPAGELATALRREITLLDPDLPIWLGPYTLADMLWESGVYGSVRNHAVVFLILAGIALLLASIGLYAVLAYLVSRRTQEIGLRMAIGASACDVLKVVFREGVLQVGAGLAIGLAGAIALNRVLRTELVGVSPSDPMALVGACAVLLLAAFLGCWIPAQRAMRIDPVAALRHE